MKPSPGLVEPRSGDDPALFDLVEEMATRLQSGEAAEVEAWIAAQGEHAERLRRLLPAMQAMAELGSSAGGSGPRLGPGGEPVSGVLGDFRIVREVGRGGMGVVYEAEQISLSRRVALKVLPFAATMDPRQLQRFHNEARAAASLHQEHIVPVYGVGVERGVHYYAMQFVEGQTLAQLIAAQRGPAGGPAADPRITGGVPVQPGSRAAETAVAALALTVPVARGPARYRAVAEWIAQAAGALEHAHALGVVHRDVKPANLMIDAHGKLWVTDFGLARFGADAGLTMTGDVLGTLRYMSPEQALAKHGLVDHRTDVYALGATLYELLSLRPALDGKDREEVLRKITFEEPRPPRQIDRGIPADLETICLKALAKEPAERYATAQELADDLRRFLDNRPIQARRPSLGQRVRKWARRHHTAILSAAVVLLAAVLALSGETWLLWREKEETRAALAQVHARNRFARQAADEMYTQVAEQWLGEQPGLTEVQRDFLQKALQFYEEFADEQGSDLSVQWDRGRAYARIARIQYGLEHQEEAERAVRQALVLVEHLATASPDVPEYRRELGKSHHNLGLVLATTGRLKGAEQAYRQAVLLQEQLVAESPTVPEYQDELANSYNSLGNLLRTTGRLKEAEQALQEAVTRFKKVAADSPAGPRYRDQLARTYRNLGVVLRDAGRLKEAEQVLREALAIDEKLAADFSVPDPRQKQLADIHVSLGNVLARDGDHEAAAEQQRQSLEILTRFARAFPHVPDYRRDLAGCHNNLAQELRASGDRAAAEEHCRQALDLRAQLAKDSPTVPDHRHFLAASHIDMGNLRRDAGDPKAAAEHYRQAFELYAGLVKEAPAVSAYYHGLDSALGNWWLLLREQGGLAEIQQFEKQAIDLLGAAMEANPTIPECRGSLCNRYRERAEMLVQLREPAEASQAAVQFARLKPEEWQVNLAAACFLSQCVLLAEQDRRLSAEQRRENVEAYERQARAFLQQALERGADDRAAQNDLAEFLATCPDPRLRDPGRAVTLAKKVVEQEPQQAACWNTLGMAYYSAGDWRGALAALDHSVHLPSGENSYNYFLLAMAHYRLGEKDQAQQWYDRAVAWMAKNQPHNARLGSLRSEAAELLGIKDQPASQGKACAPTRAASFFPRRLQGGVAS